MIQGFQLGGEWINDTKKVIRRFNELESPVLSSICDCDVRFADVKVVVNSGGVEVAARRVCRVKWKRADMNYMNYIAGIIYHFFDFYEQYNCFNVTM